MFSSDKNIEIIGQLIKLVKHSIGLQGEYLKLDVMEKTVKIGHIAYCYSHTDCSRNLIFHFTVSRSCHGTIHWLSRCIWHSRSFLYSRFHIVRYFQKKLDRKASYKIYHKIIN